VHVHERRRGIGPCSKSIVHEPDVIDSILYVCSKRQEMIAGKEESRFLPICFKHDSRQNLLRPEV
jgi:hypothetical protein